MIRVALSDDSPEMRVTLRLLLGLSKNIEVVCEASNGQEALRLIKVLQPNIVLMDITMPELNGLEAAKQIAKEFPDVRILILSMHANEEYVKLALQVGAAGYLLKGADASELELAIRSVARGEAYLSPGVSKQLVQQCLQGEKGKPGLLDPLTSRQREILQLVAEGLSTKEIAHKLNLSTKTVETHRTQLMERLDIHNVSGLVRYAIRIGLIPANR